MDLSKTTKPQVTSSGAMLFLFPIVGIVLAILLFIFVIPTGFSQITQKITSYKESRQKEEILTKKLAVLKTISQDALDKTSQAVIALPDRNPSLMVISQMKTVAAGGNVLVTSIKSLPAGDFDENTGKTELVFGLEGPDYQSLLSTLTEFSKRAPMTTVDISTLSDIESKKIAEVHIIAYWSKLPENIPAVTEPLVSFSEEELTTLRNISGLTAPEFNTLSPEQGSGRDNPFN